jgi:LysR family transcriptional regulator, glycine cleavage system transcriptional activator
MTMLQRRHLPSHAVLRSFESAARHESFTLAAEELHLTQSAISRQVKELEQTVGVALFRRVGRRVVLTNAGSNLAGDLKVDLENIRHTMMRAISAGDMEAALRVAILPGFASRWLIPRLPGFLARHPDIQISMSTRLEAFDMEQEHFDLAIHFGAKDWPNTDMRLLCNETLVAVASPAFRRRQKITSLGRLSAAPLLHMTTRPLAWQEYFDQAGLAGEQRLSGKYFDQFSMIIAGAKASLGAGLLPTYLIEHELDTGALVVLNKSALVTENGYYMVTPLNQQNNHVTAFCDWMLSSVSGPSM